MISDDRKLFYQRNPNFLTFLAKPIRKNVFINYVFYKNQATKTKNAVNSKKSEDIFSFFI